MNKRLNRIKSLSCGREVIKGILFLMTVALFVSCAQDGFDENEQFEAKVRNAQLESPKEFTLTASADGKKQTIVWPVVYGASGYQVTLYDASNMSVALTDSLVEGCTVTLDREEDVNYVLKILAKGNASLGNSDASEATQFTFSTFTPTFKTIPAGSDLNEWFAANPVPEDSVGKMLNFDLEGGAEYTVARPVMPRLFIPQQSLRLLQPHR